MNINLRNNPRKVIPVIIDKIDDLPVAESGLQPGDIILSIDGEHPFYNFLIRFVRQQLVARERFFVGNAVEIKVQQEEEN